MDELDYKLEVLTKKFEAVLREYEDQYIEHGLDLSLQSALEKYKQLLNLKYARRQIQKDENEDIEAARERIRNDMFADSHPPKMTTRFCTTCGNRFQTLNPRLYTCDDCAAEIKSEPRRFSAEDYYNK